MIPSARLLTLALLVWASLCLSSAFVGQKQAYCSKCRFQAHVLEARRGRISRELIESLGKEDGNEEEKTVPPVGRKARRARPKKSGEIIPETFGVSPALSKWAAKMAEEQETTTVEVVEPTTVEDVAAPTFVPFEAEKKGKKGNKNKNRKIDINPARAAELEKFVVEFEKLLEQKNLNMNTLQARLKYLLGGSAEERVSDFRVLMQGSKMKDYRMAWVGSDSAICEIGTGLHKVPLARLQEIFLKLGQGRLEVYEVISILGPFPNVRNTLQGTSKFSREDEFSRWKISYDSMVDGTGREILAEKEENVREVLLDVWFASEQVILASVPGDIKGANPLRDNGANVLLFTREPDMDVAMEKLRVL